MDTVSVAEASAIFKDVLKETISEVDIYGLATSKKIKLSMIFHEHPALDMYRQHLNIKAGRSVDEDNPSIYDLMPIYDDDISIEGIWDICPNVSFYDLYCYTEDIKGFEYEDVDLVLKKGDRYITDEMLPLKPNNPIEYRILNRHPSYSIVIKKDQIDLFIEVFLKEKNKYIADSPLVDEKLLTENQELRSQILRFKESLDGNDLKNENSKLELEKQQLENRVSYLEKNNKEQSPNINYPLNPREEAVLLLLKGEHSSSAQELTDSLALWYELIEKRAAGKNVNGNKPETIAFLEKRYPKESIKPNGRLVERMAAIIGGSKPNLK